MKKVSETIIIVILTFFIAGCAAHNAVLQPNLMFDLHAQQNGIVKDGIKLLVKPIYLKSDLITYFDQDLLKYGILPVQISILNKSNSTIYFSTEGINLMDTNNNRCPLLSVDSVIDKCKKSYWRTAGWTVAFGVFGLIPSAINVLNTNEKIQSDYDSRVLKSGNMVPGSTTEGLAFFDVPQNISTLDNWKLVLLFKDVLNGKLISIKTGLHGKLEVRPKQQLKKKTNPQV